MNQIEVAELIIENGSCNKIPCKDCPAKEEATEKGYTGCYSLWGGDDSSTSAPLLIEWMKKENL